MIRLTPPLDGPIEVPIYGAYDPEIEGLAVLGRIPGVHVNAPAEMLADHPAWEAYRVFPQNPRRLFGVGTDEENRAATACLVFADEAEAVAVLGGDFMSEEHGDDE